MARLLGFPVAAQGVNGIMMRLVLRVLLGLSALIELVVGGALLIQRGGHPWIAALLGRSDQSASELGFLALFLGLACVLGAALQLLALRWHLAERDEAYALINLYGGFLLLGGIALHLAFSRAAQSAAAVQGAPAAWVPLIVDALRGLLLLVAGNVERISPQTLNRLSLPDRPSRREVRREEYRDRPRERSDRRSDRGDRSSRRRSDRGRSREGTRAPAAAATGRAAAPAPSRAAEPAAGTAERKRRRGRRGGARRRGGRSGEGARQGADGGGEPAPGYEAQVDRPEGRALGTREDSDRPRESSDQPREAAERTSGASRAGRSERPRRSGGRERSDRGGRSDSRERSDRRDRGDRPRRSDLPPSSERIGLIEESPTASQSGVRIVTPEVIEAGRRPKQGRYSISGALFRPRQKRVRRPLGGETGRDWSWPAAPPAPVPPPAQRAESEPSREEERASQPASEEDLGLRRRGGEESQEPDNTDETEDPARD